MQRDPMRNARALTAALSAAAGLALAAVPAGAQLSPGPLAAAHQELDGAISCFKCHSRAGAGSMDERCLACHVEVAWTIEARRGLHGHAPESAPDCAHCHPDHAGRDLDLVRWEEGSPRKFDHTRSGWPLAGKHAGLECRACHRTEFQRSPAAPLIKHADRAASWLGLDTECASCHDDSHRGQLGSTCVRCHDTRAWKPAPAFDHAASAFPLTGKHRVTACVKCHLPPGRVLARNASGESVPLYKPLAHGECSACHRDPHVGRFGAGCAGCHSTKDFRKIRPGAFDHNRTRYPLRGRHATAACASCHDPRTAWGPKPAFATCTSCHRDAHAGQATIQGKPVDCAACHRVDGFRPSTYTVAQHQSTAYALAGRHATVGCVLCHGQDPALSDPALGSAGVIFRPEHARCADCHEDPHGGQLRTWPAGGECESCHDVTGFNPSRFTAREHSRLRLVLEGRHTHVACTACHGAARSGLPPPGPVTKLGPARFAFAIPEIECQACHADPHGGRFARGGARARAEGCRACHGMQAFRPATMDVAAHSASGFALEGAHRAVACHLCHEELKRQPPASTLLLAAATLRPLRFEEKARSCAGCHPSPHGEQFAGKRDRGECESCHGVDAFAPASRFDHNRDSAFRLEGAHARVACTACHRNERGKDGKTIVIYRPVPRRCESCHVAQPVGPLSSSDHHGDQL